MVNIILTTSPTEFLLVYSTINLILVNAFKRAFYCLITLQGWEGSKDSSHTHQVCWAQGASNYIFIDQSALGEWCRQYYTGHLNFPRTFFLVPIFQFRPDAVLNSWCVSWTVEITPVIGANVSMCLRCDNFYWTIYFIAALILNIPFMTLPWLGEKAKSYLWCSYERAIGSVHNKPMGSRLSSVDFYSIGVIDLCRLLNILLNISVARKIQNSQ